MTKGHGIISKSPLRPKIPGGGLSRNCISPLLLIWIRLSHWSLLFLLLYLILIFLLSVEVEGVVGGGVEWIYGWNIWWKGWEMMGHMRTACRWKSSRLKKWRDGTEETEGWRDRWDCCGEIVLTVTQPDSSEHRHVQSLGSDTKQKEEHKRNEDGTFLTKDSKLLNKDKIWRQGKGKGRPRGEYAMDEQLSREECHRGGYCLLQLCCDYKMKGRGTLRGITVAQLMRGHRKMWYVYLRWAATASSKSPFLCEHTHTQHYMKPVLI